MEKAALLDALERMFWSAVQAFFGSLAASPVFTNLGLGWQDALKIASFVTLASLVKNVLALAASRNAQIGVDSYEYKPNPEP